MTDQTTSQILDDIEAIQAQEQRQSFLQDYVPVNAMPDRERILQALPQRTLRAAIAEEDDECLQIELEASVSVDELGALFNMLQPNHVYISDSRTIIHLTWF